MKIKNISDYTITMHTAKVTKEILEIEPTHYISNNVNDKNYDEAFALLYNQAFKKYFETVNNIRFISKEDDITLDWKVGQVFVHQSFEYDVVENMDEYFMTRQKAEGVTSVHVGIFYKKYFKEALDRGAIICIKEPEIELCWGYSEELDTNNVVYNWNIEFAIEENLNEKTK